MTNSKAFFFSPLIKSICKNVIFLLIILKKTLFKLFHMYNV